MSESYADLIAEFEKKIALLERRSQRDRQARKQAEQLLETKSNDLFSANQKLQQMADSLEQQVHDRTQELEIERNNAIKLSKVKSEFLAVMSHEIRTPINAIIGSINLLKDEITTTEAQELLEIASGSSSLLIHIINDILDYSKIDAGQLELSEIDVNLGKFIENIEHSFKSSIEQKGLCWQLDIDPQLSDWVHFDPHRLQQVINNYLSNAIKFTLEGCITLKVARVDQQLEFTVTDNGIGIPHDKMDRLFKDFSQVDASTTRKYGGTGLGLVISKRLIEMMGGHVFVSSEENLGSTFGASIPYQPVQAADKNPPQSSAITAIGNQRHLLVVDDNKVNILIAQKILSKLGFQVSSCQSGPCAIETLRCDDSIELVLMDCQMPEMSGFEATEAVRQLGIHTPIIALTANTSEEDKNAALSAGMNDFLTKPLDIQKTVATLGKHLNTAT